MASFSDSEADSDDMESVDEYEYVSLKMANDCARLPADAPADRAHLIDMSTYDIEAIEESGDFVRCDVKIWDSICTMLFKISATVLDQFFDSQTFQLVQEFTGSATLIDSPMLIIWRQGREVLVGHYIRYATKDLLEFDACVRAKINYDGSWKLTSATYGKYTKDNLEDLWNKVYVRTRINREITVSTEEERDDFARQFSEGILNREFWNVSPDWTRTITVT